MPTKKSRAPPAAYKTAKEAKNTQDSQTPNEPHARSAHRAGHGRPAANNEGLVEPTSAGGGLTRRRGGQITMSQLRRDQEELAQAQNDAPSQTRSGNVQPIAPSPNATANGSANDSGKGSSKDGKKNKSKGSRERKGKK